MEMGSEFREIDETLKRSDWQLELYNKNQKVNALETFLSCTDEKHIAKDFFESKLNSDDIVLDVGAGTGLLTCFIADHVKKVKAVDPSEKSLNKLQQRTIQKSIDNIELVNKTWSKVNLDRQYNTAIFSHSIHLIDNKPDAINKMQAYTKGPNYIITNGEVERSVLNRAKINGETHLSDLISRFSNALPESDYFQTADICSEICRDKELKITNHIISPTVRVYSEEDFVDVFATMFGRNPANLRNDLKLRLYNYYNMNSEKSQLNVNYTNCITEISDYKE